MGLWTEPERLVDPWIMDLSWIKSVRKFQENIDTNIKERAPQPLNWNKKWHSPPIPHSTYVSGPVNGKTFTNIITH